MNAYELAIKLLSPFQSDIQRTMIDAANMLSQQADRIKELEKQTKPLSDEEIFSILSKELECVDEEYLKRCARAIEERHGIK